MKGNKDLIEALEQIEKEKSISKETLLEAIENSLIVACKNHYGKSDNIKVTIDRDTIAPRSSGPSGTPVRYDRWAPLLQPPGHCDGS